MSDWSISNIPDLSGRTFAVTGANSGIGRTATEALAGAGAHVVLAVRDVARGEAVAAEITGSTEVRRLDLADLASVREFADAWQGDLDVLVNNAGVMAVPESRTKDGFETQFGTNHLGHFALTNLLLPYVTDRVVTVSSMAHKNGRIQLDDPNLTGRYGRWQAYGQSKLANLLFTRELQHRLTAAGSSVRSLAAHPGTSSTNLAGRTGNSVVDTVTRVGLPLIAQSSSAGALPTLYAAVEDLPGDSYAGPSGFMQMRGAPKLVGRSALAADDDLARRLWDLSEELTGVTFPLPITAS